MDNNTEIEEVKQAIKPPRKFVVNKKSVFLILLWVTFLITAFFSNTLFVRDMQVRMDAVDNVAIPAVPAAHALAMTNLAARIDAIENMGDADFEIFEPELLFARRITAQICVIECECDPKCADKCVTECECDPKCFDGDLRTIWRRGEIRERDIQRLIDEIEVIDNYRQREIPAAQRVRSPTMTELRRVRTAVRNLEDARQYRNQTLGFYLGLNAFLLLMAIGITMAIEGNGKKEMKKEE